MWSHGSVTSRAALSSHTGFHRRAGYDLITSHKYKDVALGIVNFALTGVKVCIVVILAANGKSHVLKVDRELEGI